MGASEEPVSVDLPAVPSCDIKPVFYQLCYTSMAAKRHGVRQAAAMKAMHSYGIS
jgi:hypothetical protein